MTGNGIMAPEQPRSGSRRYLRIGRYEVLAHIATGGMGAVYRAQDTETGGEVALKVLSPEFAANPIRLERFRREARHGSRLQHENIVRILEFGEANGIHYLALEYVDGVDLHTQVSENGPCTPEEAVEILTQAVRALDHAYQQGIVHRDIKPSNILLTTKDGAVLVKLTDFGVARMLSDEECRVTGAGLTVGTIDYMAPEQARDSGLADIRSDLYSLGCTLFHMLAGRPPFFEGSLTERVYKHIEAEPPDVRQFNPAVPPLLVAILRRLLAKKPADRYQSPAELLEALAPPPTADLLPAPEAPPPAPARVPAPRTPSSEPAARPAPSRRPRQKAADSDDAAPTLALGEDQHRVAVGQFERAQEAMAGGSTDYARELLLSCCKLDPGNLRYRKALRRAVAASARPSGSFAWLGSLASKTRLKAARRAGDHRKVLEYGEEVLARNPRDVGAHVDMAEAAEALGQVRLAVWFLEQARKVDPANRDLARSLAQLYEKLRKFSQAIALWELLREADPSDAEASRKVRDLAAHDTIARGNYVAQTEEG